MSDGSRSRLCHGDDRVDWPFSGREETDDDDDVEVRENSEE